MQGDTVNKYAEHLNTTTLSGRTVMAVEERKKEERKKEREKVNDYSGTIVSERRRWRTHTLRPKLFISNCMM